MRAPKALAVASEASLTEARRGRNRADRSPGRGDRQFRPREPGGGGIRTPPGTSSGGLAHQKRAPNPMTRWVAPS